MMLILLFFILGFLTGVLAPRPKQKITGSQHDYDEVASALIETPFHNAPLLLSRTHGAEEISGESNFVDFLSCEWDEPSSVDTTNVILDINPATGLMMTDYGVDLSGNPYGVDLLDI
jgi:hypothetical protein